MDTMLRIEGDPQADALYIYLSELPVAYSKEFSNTIVGDFSQDGTLVGIDIQQVSQLAAAQAQGWQHFGAQFTLAPAPQPA